MHSITISATIPLHDDTIQDALLIAALVPAKEALASALADLGHGSEIVTIRQDAAPVVVEKKERKKRTPKTPALVQAAE